MDKLTLLVVDDVEMNRHMIRGIFKDEFDVLEAENGADGLKIIQTQAVNIVITDIFMPVMDGYTLIQKIRDIPEYQSIPVIAITESDQASRKKALKAGADDLIYKPFITAILQNRVKGLLFDGFDLRRYKLAYENNPIPFVLFHVIDRPDTPNYKVMYLNKAARDAFSPPYTVNLLQTDEKPELRDSLLNALRSGDTQRNTIYETEIKSWIDLTIYPDGTGLVAAMINDITGEINTRVETANKEAEKAKQERNSTREILENIPSGIMVFHVVPGDIIIAEANSAGCNLLEFNHKEILGAHCNDILQHIHADDVPMVKKVAEKLATPNSYAAFKCRIFNDIKNEYVWFSAQANSRLQADGDVYLFVSYVDITTERNLEQTKTELLAAKKANEAKTAFLSRVSHDMRTPLNGIMGMTTLLKEKITDAAALQDLEQLQLSGKYLLNLVADTLDVSRIESGKLELHPTVCDGREVFNNIVSLTNPNMQAKNLHFNIHAANIPFTLLYIDVGRLEQVIINILGNAIKFTPEGGTIDCTMENLSVENNVITDRIIIKDNGIGMSKEFLPKLFEPFTQEHGGATATASGTGLGMTIVKQIVTLMNGTINVESEPGKGTTFTLVLPFAKATDKQIKEYQTQKQQVFDVGNLNSIRVLLCEDHPLNATIATRLLEKKGMIVEHAANGQIGVDMFEKSSIGYYNIILMDIRMPVMDGLAATKAIRRLSRSDARTVPIVAMSANAFENDIKTAKAAGMDGHISKPVDTEKMYATIGQMLHIQRTFKRIKILLVDDIEINREVIKAALGDEYKVLEANNGKEALDVLAEEKGIEVVITDLQMPVMDGFELIKTIRKNAEYNHISILANTQYGDPEQEEHLLDIGANDFIYKPTTPTIVKSRVHNILKR